MKTVTLSVLFLSVSVLSAAATGMPAEVIIIRHAEKPPRGPHLSAKGVQRAEALPKYFESESKLGIFNMPVAIFAAHPGHTGNSDRSIKTVEPFARKQGLRLQLQFKRDQVSELVNEIKTNVAFDGKTVLICWPHEVIGKMASEFGVVTPKPWRGHVFDRVWLLKFVGDRLQKFQDLHQGLLPDDSKE